MLYLRRCSGGCDGSFVKNEAHTLLRRALEENGIPVEEQRFVRNEYGKPSLENGRLHFNISHSGNMAVCALSSNAVGVDTEYIRENFPGRVMKRCFTERESLFVRESSSPETAFFSLWTLKESYIKAIGKGLSYPMKKAEFIIENNNIASNTEKKFSFAQIIMKDEGYIFSVCGDALSNKVFYRSYEDKISFESLESSDVTFSLV